MERLRPQEIDPKIVLIAVGIAATPLIVWGFAILVLSLERVAS